MFILSALRFLLPQACSVMTISEAFRTAEAAVVRRPPARLSAPVPSACAVASLFKVFSLVGSQCHLSRNANGQVTVLLLLMPLPLPPQEESTSDSVPTADAPCASAAAAVPPPAGDAEAEAECGVPVATM